MHDAVDVLCSKVVAESSEGDTSTSKRMVVEARWSDGECRKSCHAVWSYSIVEEVSIWGGFCVKCCGTVLKSARCDSSLPNV